MDIIVIGSGGREHAIIKKLRENPEIERIYALPGNAGMKEANCVPIGAKDIPAVVEFAKSRSIGFAVVAPDDPLVLGMVDALEDCGVPCFGPTAAAAQIEGSKVFAKNLMKKYGIPTASYEVFDSVTEARAYCRRAKTPIVVKADGLALGKGVLICQSAEEADDALRGIMEDRMFGDSGSRVVIEEFLEGPEVSVLSFTDGKTVVPMISSMDHKRALDGDRGLNTGGMGTIAPNPYYTDEIADRCMKEIFLPTMDAMNAEGRTFKGCLYFGLMLCADGPKVIEYNCRFGDPETQVVLPLLKSDLLTVMQAVTDERLAETKVEFSDGAACCVVVASDGYPGSYEKGKPLTIEDEVKDKVFVAGAAFKGGVLVTNGGRVLGCTATAEDLPSAIKAAYEVVEKVHFENAYYRHDIGAKALKALE